MAVHNSKFKILQRKTPYIIAAAIIIAITVYLFFEFLEDYSLTSGPLISSIVSLTHTVKDAVYDWSYNWGYSGIFGMMVLESSSLPIPSEIVLPFSGYLVSIGRLDFWVTVLVATVAAIIGSLIDYYIGLRGVEALTKRKILGRVLFSMDQLTFAKEWFNKYGSLTIFLARLVPGIRTLISFPAGAAKMPLPKFVAFTAAGCLLWNTLLIYVGFYLGSNWIEVADISHYLLIAVVVASIALIVVYLLVRRRKRKTQRKEIN